MEQALAVATQSSERYVRVRRILTALTQLGLMQFAVGLGGLVRNKVMAVYLSPGGFGEFAQLTSIATAVWVFVQFGMAVGLSRNTAVAKEVNDRQRQLSTANLLTLFLAFATLAVLVPLLLSPASNPLLVMLGVHPGFTEKVFLLILLSVAPVEALRSNYVSFLQGVVDIKGLSTKRSLAILASTATAVPLIAEFHLTGACVQTFFASLFLALLLGMRCKTLGYQPLGFSWDRHTAATLTSFGGACLLSGFSNSTIDTLIRAHLISTAGMAENGFYQAAFSLSTLVTSVILGSVGSYSLAVLSQTRDANLVGSRMEELLRVVLPTAAIGLGFLGLFSQPILSTLFSPAFSQAGRYLPLLLLANYVQAAAWVTGAPLLSFGLIRAWLIIQVAGVTLRYFATVVSTPFIGVYSIPAGFLAAMIFDLVANIVVCHRNINVVTDRRMLIPFFAGGITVLGIATRGLFVHHLLEYVGASFALSCIVATMAWPEVHLALSKINRKITL